MESEERREVDSVAFVNWSHLYMEDFKEIGEDSFFSLNF